MKQQNFEIKNDKDPRGLHQAEEEASREACRSRLNLSWSNWGFGMEPLAASAARLQKAGIALHRAARQPLRPRPGLQAAPRRRKILGDHGIKVGGVCGMFSADNDLSSNRAIHRQAAIDYLKREVAFRRRGGRQLHAGGARRRGPAAARTTTSEFERSVETLRLVADLFVQHGVRAAIEPIRSAEVSFCHTFADAKRYIAAVDHPGRAAHQRRRLPHAGRGKPHRRGACWRPASMLTNLHLADTNRCALGKGSLDLDTIIMALYLIGYNRTGTTSPPSRSAPAATPTRRCTASPTRRSSTGWCCRRQATSANARKRSCPSRAPGRAAARW